MLTNISIKFHDSSLYTFMGYAIDNIFAAIFYKVKGNNSAITK